MPQPAALVTPSAVRYHRRALGLTQTGLADGAGVSTSYVKQFESERLKPSADFLRKLAAFFAEQDVPAEKLAQAYSTGGQIDTTPKARPGRVASMATVPLVEERQCFFIDRSVPEELLDELMSRWEKNEDRVAELFRQEIRSGILADYNEDSEKALREVFALLAENCVIFKLLTGWKLLDENEAVGGGTVAGVILTHYADIIKAKNRALGGQGAANERGEDGQ